jgi:transcriptional regulator with XRE-family HTH domain
VSRIPLNPLGGNSLGDYLREQRQSARLSLRQLADLAGISNPYLSQIERGLKKPSAEILQQLAKGLEVSAESLYVQAGILDERHGSAAGPIDTRAVIKSDPALTDRQRRTLIDIYDSFVEAGDSASTRESTRDLAKAAADRAATPGTATRKTATPKTAKAPKPKPTKATRKPATGGRSSKTTR